jgi:hypothetical protein
VGFNITGQLLIIYSVFVTYESGPKNNRNVSAARELGVVARCGARCRESTQY